MPRFLFSTSYLLGMSPGGPGRQPESPFGVALALRAVSTVLDRPASEEVGDRPLRGPAHARDPRSEEHPTARKAGIAGRTSAFRRASAVVAHRRAGPGEPAHAPGTGPAGAGPLSLEVEAAHLHSGLSDPQRVDRISGITVSSVLSLSRFVSSQRAPVQRLKWKSQPRVPRLRWISWLAH